MLRTLSAGRSRAAPHRRVRRHVPIGVAGAGAGRNRVGRGRSHRRVRGGARLGRRHTRGVDRDAHQPHAHDRRHRRGVRRSRTRAARSSWSTTRSPRRICNSRSRSVPTWSCTPPPSTSAATPTWSVGSSCTSDAELAEQLRVPAERDRRGARPVRLLPRAARHEDARGAHGPSLRERARRSPTCSPVTPRSSACCIPGLPDHPGHDVARQPDARLRRHGVVRRRRWRGRRARHRGPHTRSSRWPSRSAVSSRSSSTRRA